MRLYIWVDPYRVNYGDSMVFAVADSEEEARRIATDPNVARAYRYGEYLYKKEGCPLPTSSNLGPPTRVVELPCAEWHEWSE